MRASCTIVAEGMPQIAAHVRAELLRAFDQLVEPDRVLRDVVGVVQAFTDDDVHHGECECRIGARRDGDVVGALSR
jgi:hypothetical protein